ncbi:hypothetical protein HDA40_002780 [Hamadaea flava]|uniref:DUF6789 family protein n=1 Tax=Hamadaea flava TaxID=1742688 RepID=A0ABV8LIE4_9ACTN|nr:DUF6789 family protein [Hamadaea flava]MCP2324273.1 hypothetical protein [Hamadaea flava]
MNVWAALAGGFVGTVLLTTAMRMANELKLTRTDLPFLLGTIFTDDRSLAKAIGYLIHFVNGLVFALLYVAVFAAIGYASWWLGALFGLLHGLFAATAIVTVLLPLVHPRMGTPYTSAPKAAQLETPGFLMLNYGLSTPVVMLIAHVAYGAIIGAFVQLAA